ncbi:unnamed protein product [Periconia digitata]|uniref:Uncharacterized protein n=1 Tax=Periconia digitata TaxID=1303443 RepID=A0A9W4UD04_9PLEO|nr:unnamed protein product [Periconia digitata]
MLPSTLPPIPPNLQTSNYAPQEDAQRERFTAASSAAIVFIRAIRLKSAHSGGQKLFRSFPGAVLSMSPSLNTSENELIAEGPTVGWPELSFHRLSRPSNDSEHITLGFRSALNCTIFPVGLNSCHFEIRCPSFSIVELHIDNTRIGNQQISQDVSNALYSTHLQHQISVTQNDKSPNS